MLNAENRLLVASLKDDVTYGGQETALNAASQIEAIRSNPCSYTYCDEGDVARFQYDDYGVFLGATLAVRNSSLAGKVHPVTGVAFDSNGFPKFDSRFDTHLPEDQLKSSDATQFRTATKSLANEVMNNPEIAKQFTKLQLEQISRGITPEGYTWHHHQDTGRMQLVDSAIHAKTGHTGGRSIWGGGRKIRSGRGE
ncbi:hypothetical protein PAESOLCIP111_05545 [Paenibacillus solanacearum]|uniref:HNH endonuclease n=1 Tax=Paenibacillus solanacearum TaxID=2048548 RepID=A0A916K6B2_9BACL|nr:HNH endonuclease [Paenibacillus solanacearum]CAG7648178.1 hypothetical protein PAESOLCIP111_05545 [Paenibacillus solanacearum]